MIDAVLDRTGVEPGRIDDVIYGCVSQIGPQTFNIARTSVLSSRLPESVPGVSIDRQCGSSQQAIHFAAQAVMSGTQDLVIAGGVESMSQVPIGSPVTVAKELGNPFSGEIGRRYPGENFSQFTGAERMARKYGVSKADLDRFAYESHRRAAAATEAGRFKQEILPLDVPGKTANACATTWTRAFAGTPTWTPSAACSRWRRTASSAPPTPARSPTAPRRCWWPANRRCASTG